MEPSSPVPPRAPSHSADRRGPSNLLYYVVGAAFALTLILTLVSAPKTYKLRSSAFFQLVKSAAEQSAAKQNLGAEPNSSPATGTDATSSSGKKNEVSSSSAATPPAAASASQDVAANPVATVQTQPAESRADGAAQNVNESASPAPSGEATESVVASQDVPPTAAKAESPLEGPSKPVRSRYVVVESPGTRYGQKQEFWGYYELQQNLVVGDSRARGKVKRVKLDPVTLRPIDKEQLVSFYSDLNSRDREQLGELLHKTSLSWDVPSQPNPLETWGPFVLISMMFLGVLYLMMKRLGAQPQQFGRSRGKMYAQEELGVTFEQVAGIDEALEEVKEIVDFLRQPEKFQKLGGRIPKGILLVGPPGTGKTLLAKAIAGEAGVPFYGLSGSDFVEMFVGVGAARVRDTFQLAASKAPCIIFIDELDALGKTRGNGLVGSHDEREQTLNALLVEMDGFDANAGVIVMAATNRPEILDAALLRPGRFDRHVLVDKPDVKGREAILKVHATAIRLSDNVNLKEVAEITSGFVGADLANLVNEAALLAARKGKESVEMEEFGESVERISAGLEKKQRIVSEDEKLRVAYHESGHALVAHCLPNTDPVHKVSIIPRGLAALGYTMQRPEGDRYLLTHGELESRILVLLAGTVAEELIFADISTGASNDLERASDIARSMVMDYGMSRLGRVSYRRRHGSPFLVSAEAPPEQLYSEQTAREIDDEVRRLIDESIDKVRQLLKSRQAALDALAKRLLEVEVVDAAELRKIMEEHAAGPQLVPGTSSVRRGLRVEAAVEPPAGAGEAGA